MNGENTMRTQTAKKLPARKLGDVKRKTIMASQEQWVKTEKLFPDNDIPLLIQPAEDGLNLVEWGKNNRSFIEKLLLEHRALLFRGFNVQSPEEFEAFIMATSDGDLLEYRDRTTPAIQRVVRAAGSISQRFTRPNTASLLIMKDPIGQPGP